MPTPNITLNASQENALKLMKEFVESSADRCFILTGYAGTGKTTLMRFFIEHLKNKDIRFVLLSTTGRAAKILANYTNNAAGTIHSMIYSYKGLNKDLSDVNAEEVSADSVGQLYINFEPTSIQYVDVDDDATIYIIDESSMISDTKTVNITQAKFGSGKLLTELLNYDTRPSSKFLFVGDPCQLPPIEGKISPALDEDYIANTFGYGVKSASLTQVMRQKGDNTIIAAADKVRILWKNAPLDKNHYGENKVWGRLPFKAYPDFCFYDNLNDMINEYIGVIKSQGYNESVFICQSNQLANKISQEVRQQLNFNSVLQPGDLLMVQQNQFTTGLMNGDMVEVVSCNPTRTKTIKYKDYNGYRSELLFREITVKELFTQKTYTTLTIETILTSGNNNLDSYQQTGLFLDFVLRMKKQNITQKKDPEMFYEKMKDDPFLNAMRCSYGYAVTCHKSQGGEWNKVFVAFVRRNNFLNPTKDIYQWIYTAITRAKQKVGFVNDFFFN